MRGASGPLFSFRQAFEDLAVFFKASLHTLAEGFICATGSYVLLDRFANGLRYRDIVSASYGGEFYRQILRKTQTHHFACHR
jgi:hypothetical protein